ncbi:MAG: hypothetical protein JRD89_12630 [Deltaproteobacteria bacterium]|nr:hypothetical protein [Deltaproteobacteria bacterium]MBW2674238.1 hypothetical protein [Deltaproteobacteria bacterium]
MFIEIVEDRETFELEISDSTLTLRRFDSEAYRQIEKRHTKKQKNLRTGQIFTETDEYAVNADLLDYMIVDWKGIKSPITADDVPCTKEMKNKLPGSVKVQIIEACDADSITDNKEKKESGGTL